MAKQTDIQNAVANRAAAKPNNQVVPATPEQGLQQLIKQNFKSIQSLVPAHVKPERLARIGINAATRTPKLFECAPETLIGAIVNCAALGLEPNLIGHAYILPFYNGKTKRYEAQFQIGYKGAIDLARRSGELDQLYAHEVYEGDDFNYSYGLRKDLQHTPNGEDDPAKITHVYAVYHLKDGGFDFVVMTRNQIEKHRDRFSKSKDRNSGNVYGPWADHFTEMAKKTVIIKLLKTAPLSIERNGEKEMLQEMINRDTAITEVKTSPVTQESYTNMQYVESSDEPETVEAEPEQSEKA